VALSRRDFKLRISEKPRPATSGFTPSRDTLVKMLEQELGAINPDFGAQNKLKVVSGKGGIEITGADKFSPTAVDNAVRRVMDVFMKKTQESVGTKR